MNNYTFKEQDIFKIMKDNPNLSEFLYHYYTIKILSKINKLTIILPLLAITIES
jgi:hypothetical protein